MEHPENKRISQGSNTKISYGVCQIPGKADEDRFSCVLNQKLSDNFADISDVYSFGVFDGHEGSLASDTCAAKLHRMAIMRYNESIESEKSRNDGSPRQTEKKGLHEAHFCDALRNASQKIDLQIRETADSGTTAVLLNIFHLADGKCRVVCSWTGDSRSVMFRNDAFDPKAPPISILLTEDHKPALARERIRIEKRGPFGYNILPIEATPKTFRDLNIDYSEHSKKIIAKEPATYEEGENPEDLTPDDYVETKDGLIRKDRANVPQTMLIRYEQSFIGQRALVGAEHIKGPLAVMGRFGISLNMTRSIGDRYGPRSCICQPDISACTVLAEQYARFVIGSDGLWDVVTVEDCEKEIFRHKDPVSCANHLALKAWRARKANNMRLDDITVTVFDINPHLYIAPPATVKGDCGCSIS